MTGMGLILAGLLVLIGLNAVSKSIDDLVLEVRRARQRDTK